MNSITFKCSHVLQSSVDIQLKLEENRPQCLIEEKNTLLYFRLSRRLYMRSAAEQVFHPTMMLLTLTADQETRLNACLVVSS